MTNPFTAKQKVHFFAFEHNLFSIKKVKNGRFLTFHFRLGGGFEFCAGAGAGAVLELGKFVAGHVSAGEVKAILNNLRADNPLAHWGRRIAEYR